MTEFKQIIGRGTRINEDFGKYYFTIIDFKKATELFADADFDGDPVQIYEPKNPGDSPVPPDVEPDDGGDQGEFPEGDNEREIYDKVEDWDFSGEVAEEGSQLIDTSKVKRFVVDNVTVKVLAERVQYFDANGKLITESLKDYTRKAIRKEYSTLDEFLLHWTQADKKQAVIDELSNQGIFFEALAEEVGRDCDPFDLVCHVVWDKPPLTRKERADEVKKRNYFTKYGEKARSVLDALLEKYADQGVVPIEETQILSVSPFNEIGTPMEIIRAFGGKDEYHQAILELESALYSA